MKNKLFAFLTLALLATLNSRLSTLHAQGTGFTYHGSLNDSGNPATGAYDLRFALFGAASSGAQVAGPLTNAATAVSNGLFVVTLDFGSGVFNGSNYWLEIAVRTNGNGSFATLSPRQQILPTPYAMYAPNAGTAAAANSVATGSITSAGIASNAITGGNIASGQVVRSLNGLTDAVTVAPGNNVILTSLSNTITISASNQVEVPTSTIVLSLTASNAALTAAGFARLNLGVQANSTMTWAKATNSAPWRPRVGMAAVVFSGRIWVMGGVTYNAGSIQPIFFNDVWSSLDGVNWTLAIDSAPWSGRMSHAAVVFNGRMWVLGGGIYGQSFSDVWSSADGVNWTQATNSAPWGPRTDHGAVVLNGKMWMLGGKGGTPTYFGYYGGANDVWSSQDGTNWIRATTAPWSGRSVFGAAVLNGQMWVMGGIGSTVANDSYRYDVWSSPDGVNWTMATNSVPWTTPSNGVGNYFFPALAFNGHLWVFFGQFNGAIWSSPDGISWTQSASPSPNPPRICFPAVVFNGEMWLMGGQDILGLGYLNDVWHTEINTNVLSQFYFFQKQ